MMDIIDNYSWISLYTLDVVPPLFPLQLALLFDIVDPSTLQTADRNQSLSALLIDFACARKSLDAHLGYMLVHIPITSLALLYVPTSRPRLALLFNFWLDVVSLSLDPFTSRTSRPTIVPVPTMAVTSFPLSRGTVLRPIMMSPIPFSITDLFL